MDSRDALDLTYGPEMEMRGHRLRTELGGGIVRPYTPGWSIALRSNTDMADGSLKHPIVVRKRTYIPCPL
jgi:hypothetical protein